MRIRQIKPEFFANSDMAALPYAVRLFYIGLWCVADDAGWIEWRPERIAHDLYGYETRSVREKHVTEWADALVKTGHVIMYDCDCAFIPTLQRHQRVTGKQNFRNREAHAKHAPLTGKQPIAPERNGTGNVGGTERTGTVSAQEREGPGVLVAALGTFEEIIARPRS